MAAKITALKVLEGLKPAVISATVTVPATSPIWGLSAVTSLIPPGTPKVTPTGVPPADPANANKKVSLPLQYAAAVLTGQEDVLASIVPCFDTPHHRRKLIAEVLYV